MNAIDWAALSRLAPELVLLLIICAFMVVLIDRIYKREKELGRERAAERKERDSANSKERGDRDDAFLAALTSRDLTWHQWMSEERSYHTIGLKSVTDELKTLSALVMATNALIVHTHTPDKSV